MKAYAAFAGLSLTGSDKTGGSGQLDPISGQVTNISINKGQWAHYNQVLPAGYKTMTVAINGGTGDTDLFVRHGAQSTATLWDCRPYNNGNSESCSFPNPAAGTWYIDLNGYSNTTGLTLSLSANP